MSGKNRELLTSIKLYSYYFRSKAIKQQIENFSNLKYEPIKEQIKKCNSEKTKYFIENHEVFEEGQINVIEFFQGNIFFDAKINAVFQLTWVWYALLYVVIEALEQVGPEYREQLDEVLNRKDSKGSLYKNSLKKFRNYIFHFQKSEDPFEESDKFSEFIFAESPTDWIDDLDKKIDVFFKTEFSEIIKELKDS